MSVFGVYGLGEAASNIYYGLHALQHRGQEGAGIVTFDAGGGAHRKRGLGLVSEVFNAENLSALKGNIGVGSVQYANIAKGGGDNVQPLFFHHRSGDFAVAGDGSVINSAGITDYLEARGCLFQTSTDSELLAQLIKKDVNKPRIFQICNALNMMEGGFAFLIATRNRIYAARDKYGLKPLAVGRLAGGWVVSSETCAFDLIGAQFVRDVEPGEVVTLDDQGIRSTRWSQFQRHKLCAMEYIYYARPDSDLDGCNVHAYRKESGRRLYRECPADADIVVGVPDSSLSAAQGYAEESGLPYEMGLIKNKYVGRTFIQPSQEMREQGVRMKLSAVHSIVRGKRVVLVDDSIVRGTTSLKIIRMLRDAGATEVHVRIASPMMTHPCYYGVDTSTFEELLCSSRTLEEARKVIGADSLGYLSPESTVASCPGRTELCLACFTGEYPTSLYKQEVENE
ncbi:MAG: amidophosphoribosyltransferase [Bacteroidales bacterium]|nr:amidophosphoribosyltransferase [Bacteroidales bacterium]MBR0030329.1 amidophosphoribosyltransferase [Bacteroidales bacterium]MBR0084651.1 amidophosphoribosyltransferase [Bacteroidales bacterium]